LARFERDGAFQNRPYFPTVLCRRRGATPQRPKFCQIGAATASSPPAETNFRYTKNERHRRPVS